MFSHVFFTWILANLLHPVFLFLGSVLIGDRSEFSYDTFGILFLLFFYSLVVSIPWFIISWLSFRIIVSTSYTVFARFLLWIYITVGIALLMGAILLFILDGKIAIEDMRIFLPAVAAVAVSILIRYRQFYKLISERITIPY